MEQPNHCPYLGLKQNRAIRFGSPTSEHRCYVAGDPQEIPVDQARYCLSAQHVSCPLYLGLEVPSTGNLLTPAPTGGVISWVRALPRREQAIYLLLVSLMVLTLVAWLAIAFRLLDGSAFGLGGNEGDTPAPLVPSATATPSPTATRIPTITPTGTATPIPPTQTPFFIVVTATPDPNAPTGAPLPTILISPTPEPFTPTLPPPPTPINQPRPIVPTSPPAPPPPVETLPPVIDTPVPTESAPTAPPPTPTEFVPVPTETLRPIEPTPEPPTPEPPTPELPTPEPPTPEPATPEPPPATEAPAAATTSLPDSSPILVPTPER